ncbi:MAG TPA: fibronectin type III domain-containing protein [Acidimicrobiales bacterium]
MRKISKWLMGLGISSATLVASAAVGPVTVASARVAMSAPASSTPHRGTTAVSAADVPPQNPSSSLAPSPNFTDDRKCGFGALDVSTGCTNDVAQAVDNGRSTLESMPPLSFSLSAFEAMTGPEQLFVIANEERIDRGLAPLSGLTTQLDDVAQTGADTNADPYLSSSTLTGGAQVRSWGSNWAGGTSNALGSDYYWMYDDGTNSPNAECSTPTAAACWGHRDNVLATFVTSASCPTSGPEQYMGAADTPNAGSWGPSFAEIIVGACGSAPTDVVFTWTQAQQLLAANTGGGTTAPGTPQNVTAAPSSRRGVMLSWQAPADNGGAAITGYEIFRGRRAGAETLYRSAACTSGACTFADRHARPQATFFYQVAAVNSVGPGNLSPEVSAQSH